MSQENAQAPEPLRSEPIPDEAAELARRSYDAFNRRDLETLLRLYHSDCRWDMTHMLGWPDTPVYRGHEGLRQLFEEWFAAWDEMRVWWSDVQLVAGRFVLAAHMRGRGDASGAEVTLDWTQVGQVRDGLLYSVENYTDRAAALEAVGLRE